MLQGRLTKESKMLLVAGVATWVLVAWLSLMQIDSQQHNTLLISLCFLLFLQLFLVVASKQLTRYQPKLVIPALACQAGLILLLFSQMPNGLMQILLVIWASLLPEYLSKRGAISSMLLINVLVFAIDTTQHQNSSALFTSLLYLAFQFFAYSSSQARINEAEARLRQEQLNQQLLATRSLLSQASQQQERLRIARDLHDILGHQLTALSLQLEVLGHMASGELLPHVEQSKSVAKELLYSVRKVVREQRGLSQLDLRQPLQSLITRLPGVSLTVQSNQLIESTALAQELLLILQEGISNAVRHGIADQLSLEMLKQGTSLTVKLVDNGRHQTAIVPGSGLKGMNERLIAFGGTATLTSNNATLTQDKVNRSGRCGYTLTIECIDA
ncbi:two-component sensor histidine kinase [Shewanella mesophila]|uniref:sensor histidine kinase n=1 Tax=Shewanella mesophila TaxID=2864208 RepID=UPI001C655F13|nr:histidine kinase [Shewanella mesophila]QYJ85134.1 two-component sensor histidine kinase [Shewanella mesophila]